jgi:hypothetical protein
MFYELVDGARVQEHLLIVETPGELELLDAVNLMERGDYSGAVRRVTTAIEVVVEAVVGKGSNALKATPSRPISSMRRG